MQFVNRFIGIVKRRFFYIVLLFFRNLLLLLNQEQLYHFISALIKKKSASLSPSDSLKLLFKLENKLLKLADKESVRYGSGVHTKHRHIKYHDFFVKNIDHQFE